MAFCIGSASSLAKHRSAVSATFAVGPQIHWSITRLKCVSCWAPRKTVKNDPVILSLGVTNLVSLDMWIQHRVTFWNDVPSWFPKETHQKCWRVNTSNVCESCTANDHQHADFELVSVHPSRAVLSLHKFSAYSSCQIRPLLKTIRRQYRLPEQFQNRTVFAGANLSVCLL